MSSKNIKFFLQNENIFFKENVSFKTLTTYKCGGNALFVIYPKNVNDLKKVLLFVKNNNISFKVFGNGSNILASDNNYDGIIIRLTEMNNEVLNDNILTLECGCDLIQISNKYSSLGYSGLEFACGIPGTIGGAIYMNAGAYLHSIQEIVVDVTYLNENNDIKTIINKIINFHYRDSIFKHKNWIILKASIKLKKENKFEILSLIDERRKRRILTQALEYPSAGSVFRNPPNMYAGELIEKCNLKGKQYGDAQISNKHANFIVNLGNANSKDIRYLIDLALKEVKKQYKVSLVLEQELFNWD